MVTNSFQKELRAEKIEDLGPSEAELEAERLRVRLFLLQGIEVGLFYYLQVSFYVRFFNYSSLEKFIYINVWFSDSLFFYHHKLFSLVNLFMIISFIGVKVYNSDLHYSFLPSIPILCFVCLQFILLTNSFRLHIFSYLISFSYPHCNISLPIQACPTSPLCPVQFTEPA